MKYSDYKNKYSREVNQGSEDIIVDSSWSTIKARAITLSGSWALAEYANSEVPIDNLDIHGDEDGASFYNFLLRTKLDITCDGKSIYSSNKKTTGVGRIEDKGEVCDLCGEAMKSERGKQYYLDGNYCSRCIKEMEAEDASRRHFKD